MVNKILKVLKNPEYFIIYLNNKGFKILNDQKYISLRYKLSFNKKIDLKNPKTFNEKMQWLKLYDKKNIYTKMVDKYSVKEYVGNLIGNEYIIPNIGVYNSFKEINFNQLPEQFVMKCTHDSGGLVICDNKEKFDISLAKRKITKSLNKNYFYAGREWPYKDVKPRIIIEKYMKDEKKSDIIDYKIFCFNGSPKYILVCSDRKSNLKETFFDLEWNIAPFKRPNNEIDKSIKKPKNLDLMIKLANKLSKDIPFLRVDFYEINGKVYFGELTFFPAGGFNGFEPEEWDLKLGQLIDISKVDKNEE